ncbi:hypothetical protein [Chitinivorax sp. B]|uniref:hypothetical protein n=1 Tax=Chitinivorax sp. B TaxID=2502235 RepID=UPI0010F918AB|nr:hypothetical protein [Chitinivorax sp. B]
MNHEILSIDNLPSIEMVKRRSQALALLDAILMPEWEYRYFSFNADWNVDENESMASMRDGSGNEYFLLFTGEGAVGKVLYEVGDANPSILMTNVPNNFASFKGEPAFSLANVSYFFWRLERASTWMVSPKGLGTYSLLGFLENDSNYYHAWAQDYYERCIDIGAVNKIFNTLSIDDSVISILNDELSSADLSGDILEIFGSNKES